MQVRNVLLKITTGYLVLILGVAIFFFISSFFTLGDTPNSQYAAAAHKTQWMLAGLCALFAVGIFLSMVLRNKAGQLKMPVFMVWYFLLFALFVAPTLYFLVGILASLLLG